MVYVACMTEDTAGAGPPATETARWIMERVARDQVGVSLPEEAGDACAILAVERTGLIGAATLRWAARVLAAGGHGEAAARLRALADEMESEAGRVGE